VSDPTLRRLGTDFNQTNYKYTSSDGKTRRQYLLDVNRWIEERNNGDGMNVIDARWIDVRNGLYIDITGLSETRPGTHPNVWSCKNYHEYKTKELYPMRETMFEGVLAKVPYAYDKILTDEYQQSALVNTNYNGYGQRMMHLMTRANESAGIIGIQSFRSGSSRRRERGGIGKDRGYEMITRKGNCMRSNR
jgi:hypothetical protein